jgi:branched-subunit amino acid aminotransferase/4-amino-4-deoxychorismate lyase
MSLPFNDRGLLLGDGLFETLLAVDGAPRDWDAHMARLSLGCAALGLPSPDETELRAAAQAALASAGLDTGHAALRITWTAGSGGRGLDRPEPCAPALFATAAPAPATAEPLRLVTARTRRNGGSIASRHKTLSYLDNVLARREARQAGADEAVMLNTDGHVACAAAGNLFWVTGGRLLTPSLDCGILAGVTRAKVLAWASQAGVPVAETEAGPAALEAAEAMFVTNSLTGARPVQSLDGRALSAWPGLAALSAALA